MRVEKLFLSSAAIVFNEGFITGLGKASPLEGWRQMNTHADIMGLDGRYSVHREPLTETSLLVIGFRSRSIVQAFR